MGPVPLDMLSPFLSNESKKSIIGCRMVLGISLNVDNSWMRWAPEIDIFFAILVESLGSNIFSVTSHPQARVVSPNQDPYEVPTPKH
jgi:hypothetical protein